MVLHIVCHVVRKDCTQAVRYIVSDIVVCAVLPVRFGIRFGIIDILDLLIELRLVRFLVLHGSRQTFKLFIRFKLQFSGCRVARQGCQDLLPVSFDCPRTVMLRFYCKADRVNRMIPFRHLRLCQDILTVIQTLEAELRFSGVCCIQFHRNLAAVCEHLLQLELRSLERCSFRIDLVHIYFVGKRDDKVFFRLFRGFARLSVLVHVRVAAVFQPACVDVSFLAEDRILVQGRGEEDFHYAAVQGFVCDLRSVLAFPGKGHTELLLAVRGKRVVFHFLPVDGHFRDLLERQALLHLILERDMVLHIVCHVVR